MPLVFIPQRLGKLGLKEILTHQQCTEASFTRAERWIPSTDEWINKVCYTYIPEYYSTLKRNEILIHATTRMNPEDIIRSETSYQRTNIVGFYLYEGTSQWLSGKEAICNAEDVGSIPGLGRFPWRRKW